MTNEEAIRRILEHKRVHSLNEPRAVLINEALDLAIKALEKRPQGEWIPIRLLMEDNYHSRLSFQCNQCRYVEGYRAKYCAGCGAFMRAEDGG